MPITVLSKCTWTNWNDEFHVLVEKAKFIVAITTCTKCTSFVFPVSSQFLWFKWLFFHRNYQLLLSSQILEIQDSYVGPYLRYYRANSHVPRTQQQRILAVWHTNITENFAVLSLYRLRFQRKKVDNILKGVSLYIKIFPKLLIIVLIYFIFWMIISSQLIRSFDPKKQISDVVFATVLN